MRASVTKSFRGVVDGEIHGRTIEVGEEISGSLAEVAITEGWAEKLAGADESENSGETVGNLVENGEKDAKTAEKTVENGKNSAGADEKVGGEGGSGAPVLAEISADWKSLKWFALKGVAEKIKGSAVSDSAEAKSVIEAELARRG